MLIPLTKGTFVDTGAVSVLRHCPAKRTLSIFNRNGGVLITLMGDEADEALASVQSFIDGMKADYEARKAAALQSSSG